MKAEWQTKTLRDVCEVILAGGDVPKGRVSQEQTPHYRVPIYSNGAKNEGLYGFTDVASVIKPSVTISARGTIGYSAIRTEPFFPVVRLIVLTPDEKIVDIGFLHYSVMGMDFENTGTSIPQLTVPNLRERQICVPSLPEQQRIVGMLDEAFEGIATAKANAEKNLKNARALFDSYLESTFRRSPDEVPLSELTTDITDGDHMPPPKAPTGVPFITISNIVKRTREIDFTSTFAVPVEYFRGLKGNKRPRPGDILYTVTGATLGIPVLIKDERDFCFQRHIGLIRPKTNTDSSWLSYALLSPQLFRQATLGSTGTAQKTVSLKVLRELKVPRIGFSEQVRISNQLDALFVETQRLESIYLQKLVALDALKNSLLDRAFRGGL